MQLLQQQYLSKHCIGSHAASATTIKVYTLQLQLMLPCNCSCSCDSSAGMTTTVMQSNDTPTKMRTSQLHYKRITTLQYAQDTWNSYAGALYSPTTTMLPSRITTKHTTLTKSSCMVTPHSWMLAFAYTRIKERMSLGIVHKSGWKGKYPVVLEKLCTNCTEHQDC